jgi:hypothetical protein
LKDAVNDLYHNDPTIDDFSPETGQTEWNLTAHLAPEIAKYFPGYCYDIDILKVNLENKRPDIIIHKRSNDIHYNLLVLEVKRDRAESEVYEDKCKIQKYWFGGRLKYRFGATVNLKSGRETIIEVFANENAS